MKIVCLLLLLLNVALPLWEWRSVEPAAIIDSGLPGILLDGEYRAAQRGAVIEEVFLRQLTTTELMAADRLVAASREKSTNLNDVGALLKANARPVIEIAEAPKPPTENIEPTEKEPPAKSCYQIGPFADQFSLSAWLRNQGMKADSTLVRDIELPVDYQVLYPAAKTPEQQRINKQMLNEKGIVDLWTIPIGDNKGAFSLGVYSDIQRANLFRKQLLDKGINAEVKQRFKTSQQFFAKLMLDKTRREQFTAQGSARLSACR